MAQPPQSALILWAPGDFRLPASPPSCWPRRHGFILSSARLFHMILHSLTTQPASHDCFLRRQCSLCSLLVLELGQGQTLELVSRRVRAKLITFGILLACSRCFSADLSKDPEVTIILPPSIRETLTTRRGLFCSVHWQVNRARVLWQLMRPCSHIYMQPPGLCSSVQARD